MIPTEMEVLAFWREHTDTMGFPPSRRKAAACFGVSRVAIDRIVHTLHARGLMQAGGASHLGDAITAQGRSALRGRVAEQIPIVTTLESKSTIISEATCQCGAIHFRIGRAKCFDCEQRASA